MKKKVLLISIIGVVLAAALAVTGVLVFGNKDCQHQWGEWVTVKSATCTEEGEKTRSCTLCEESESEKLEALGHLYVKGECTHCGKAENETFYADFVESLKNINSFTVEVNGFTIDSSAIDAESLQFIEQRGKVELIDVAKLTLCVEKGEVSAFATGSIKVANGAVEGGYESYTLDAVIEDGYLYLLVKRDLGNGKILKSDVKYSLDGLTGLLSGLGMGGMSMAYASSSGVGIDFMLEGLEEYASIFESLLNGEVDDKEVSSGIEKILDFVFATEINDDGSRVVSVDFDKIRTIVKNVNEKSIKQLIDVYVGEGVYEDAVSLFKEMLAVKAGELPVYAQEKGIEYGLVCKMLNSIVQLTGGLGIGFDINDFVEDEQYANTAIGQIMFKEEEYLEYLDEEIFPLFEDQSAYSLVTTLLPLSADLLEELDAKLEELAKCVTISFNVSDSSELQSAGIKVKDYVYASEEGREIIESRINFNVGVDFKNKLAYDSSAVIEEINNDVINPFEDEEPISASGSPASGSITLNEKEYDFVGYSVSGYEILYDELMGITITPDCGDWKLYEANYESRYYYFVVATVKDGDEERVLIWDKSNVNNPIELVSAEGGIKAIYSDGSSKVIEGEVTVEYILTSIEEKPQGSGYHNHSYFINYTRLFLEVFENPEYYKDMENVSYCYNKESEEIAYESVHAYRITNVTLVDGKSCNGGYEITYLCGKCGDSYVEYGDSHYTYNIFDLQDYGACEHHYLEVEVCPCGNLYNLTHNYWDYDDVTGKYYCADCGLSFKATEREVQEECTLKEIRTLTVWLDGDEVFTNTSEYLLDNHNYVNVEIINTNGETQVIARCSECDSARAIKFTNYKVETQNHNGDYYYDYTFTPTQSGRYTVMSVHDDDYNDAYVTLYQMENGKLKKIAEDDDGAESSQFYLSRYLKAGVTYVYRMRLYDVNASANIYYLVSFNGELLSENDCPHNYNYLPAERFGTLISGASNCEEGLLVGYVCGLCGGFHGYYVDNTHQTVVLEEEIDLSEYGSECGGTARQFTCACGTAHSMVIASNCNSNYSSCENWIENRVYGHDQISDETIEDSESARVVTCSVDDPTECGLKYRYVTYYLADEEECIAYEYATYQFGYDEENNTYKKQFTFKTGNFAIWHSDVQREEVNKTENGLTVQGVIYTCSCGSSYSALNYNNADEQLVKESYVRINSLAYGEVVYDETTYEYAFRAGGERYLSREYFITSMQDESEHWEERKLEYSDDYQDSEGFFTGGYKVKRENNGSDVEHTVEEEAYGYYLDRELIVYNNFDNLSTGYWSRYSYTYSFEERCTKYEKYTDSTGKEEEKSTDCCEYDFGIILNPTCSQYGLEGDYCVYCKYTDRTQLFDITPSGHSWREYKDGYICENCAFLSDSNSQGDFVVEDLTAIYGGGKNFVVGYWNIYSLQFTRKVSIMPVGGEEIVLSGIEGEAVEGINAFAVSKAQIEELALQQGYSADEYKIIFTFVFDDGYTPNCSIIFNSDVLDLKVNSTSIMPIFVGSEGYVEITVVPNMSGYWRFTSIANSESKAVLLDANGNELVSSEGYFDFEIKQLLAAGKTYTLRVSWLNDSEGLMIVCAHQPEEELYIITDSAEVEVAFGETQYRSIYILPEVTGIWNFALGVDDVYVIFEFSKTNGNILHSSNKTGKTEFEYGLVAGKSYVLAMRCSNTCNMPISVVASEAQPEGKIEVTSSDELEFYVAQEHYKEIHVTPSKSGNWIFTSFANKDTVAYLLDANKNELANDNDSGEGNNFLIKYNLTAGESYILKVEWSSPNSWGYLPLTVIEPAEEITITNSTEITPFVISGEVKDICIIPEISGQWKFEINVEEGAYAYILNASGKTIESYSGSTTFVMNQVLVAGERYVLRLEWHGDIVGFMPITVTQPENEITILTKAGDYESNVDQSNFATSYFMPEKTGTWFITGYVMSRAECQVWNIDGDSFIERAQTDTMGIFALQCELEEGVLYYISVYVVDSTCTSLNLTIASEEDVDGVGPISDSTECEIYIDAYHSIEDILITPQASGYWTFTSNAIGNIYAIIKDSNDERVAEGDNSAEGGDLFVRCYLEAGKEYILTLMWDRNEFKLFMPLTVSSPVYCDEHEWDYEEFIHDEEFGETTCEFAGRKVRNCTVCGLREYQEEALLPHNFVNGKCAWCGDSYTYKTFSTSLPWNWNRLDGVYSEAQQIVELINSHFFEANFKFDANGEIIPGEYSIEYSFATGLEDVTSQYVGRYGVKSGESAKVWKITIREDGKWQNGDPIVAGDFVYSMQEQINPLFAYYGVDSFVNIYGVYSYYNQGKTVIESARRKYDKWNEEAMADSSIYFDLESPNSGIVQYLINAGYGSYVEDKGAAWVLQSLFNIKDDILVLQGKTYAEIFADANLTTTFNYLVSCWNGDNGELDFFCYEETYPEMDFSDVGIFAPGDYELVIALITPLELIDEQGKLTYDALYGINYIPLVHKATYEACKQEPYKEGYAWTSNYNKTLETTMSWGPYKLTDFKSGEFYVLEKNANWYGYNMSQYEGQYQTARIECEIVESYETAFLKFLSGELSYIDLNQENLGDYKNSQRIYHLTDDAILSLHLQSNKDALKAREEEGVNKTILTYKDFRKAISLVINREEYRAQYLESTVPTLGIFNSMHYHDIDSGKVYRNSDVAKQVICDIYGVNVKDYNSLDEAYASVTGYNVTLARELLEKAYAEALANGDIKASDSVVLTLCYAINTSDELNFIVEAVEELAVGTSLEGRLTIELVKYTDSIATPDDLFYAGEFDIHIQGWSGAAWDPGYFLIAYLSPDIMYSQGWKTDQYKLEMTVRGVKRESCENGTFEYVITNDPNDSFTDNLPIYGNLVEEGYNTNWYQLLNNEFAKDVLNAQFRVEIIAALEKVILDEAYAIPLVSNAKTSLISYQVEYPTYEYNTFVEFGGIRYLTYNYSDYEWAKYIQNNELDYTKSGEVTE